jgi:large subunit ribosomal protein L21
LDIIFLVLPKFFPKKKYAGEIKNIFLINWHKNMSYFVISNSGKQLVFNVGEWYDIDYLKIASAGKILYLKKILFYQKNTKFQCGNPFLEKVGINATIVQQVKGKKIKVLKTRPKKNYTRTKGHRSFFTRVQFEKV